MAWGDITPPTAKWGDITGPSDSYSDITPPTGLFLDFNGCVIVMEASEPVVTLENFKGTDDVLDLNFYAKSQWGSISPPSSSWSDI